MSAPPPPACASDSERNPPGEHGEERAAAPAGARAGRDSERDDAGGHPSIDDVAALVRLTLAVQGVLVNDARARELAGSLAGCLDAHRALAGLAAPTLDPFATAVGGGG